MAAVIKYYMDRAAVGRLLRSDQFGDAIDGIAYQVAAGVQTRLTVLDPEAADNVEVQHYTTDRRAAAVDVKTATAISLQAKYGILTNAAGDIGLTFVAY